MESPAPRARIRQSTMFGFLACLQVLLISLLVALALGCNDGQGDDQAPVDVFPRHDAPLGTDRGGQYLAGRLVLDSGCLRVEVPSNDASNPLPSRLLIIWPGAFTLSTEDGAMRIVDGLGRIAAHVGDHVRLSRAAFTYEEAQARGLIRGLSADCEGSYLLVGDEVTAFDPNSEPTELRLSDPDVFFLRQRTVIAEFQALLTAAGIGELVLDGRCLRLNGSTTIIWPAGFTPHVDRGVVQVRNGAGRAIAQVGDEIAGGGGFGSLGDGDCSGPAWWANKIKVLPDVEVYFPKQDGSLAMDQEMESFVGKLVLNRKCLNVDSVIRVRDRVLFPVPPLLIWPDTFTLGTEDEVVGIVDAAGRTVARVGDDVQFSAADISYGQAMERSGLREITPACSAPYWVVADDFSRAHSP